MKRLVFVVLLVFLASNLYAAQTTLTKDTTYVYERTTPEGGIVYRIELPCTSIAVEDSFLTWPIDISRYNSITVGYSCDTGTVWQDCSLSIVYEQSFNATAENFVRPYSHACVLDSPYVDSTGTITMKELCPADVQFIRFLIYPLAGHDITPDGIIYFYIRLSKSPMSYMRQGGVGLFSSIKLRSTGYGSAGPKYFEFSVSDNGDTLFAQWQGGGPDRRTVWQNPLYTADTFQPRTQLFLGGTYSRFAFGAATIAEVDVEVTVGSNDSVEVTRVWHRLAPATGDSASIETIGEGKTFQLGGIVIFTVKDASKQIVIEDGVDNIECGSDFVMDSQADAICLMKASATKWIAIWKEDN